MVAKTKLAYYAGLFDGEGSVGIKTTYASPLARERHWRTLALDVCIANTNPIALVEIQGIFKGSVTHVLKIPKLGHRSMFYWHSTANNALSFLLAVQSYVVMKRDQVELAIAFQERVRNRTGVVRHGRYAVNKHSISDTEYVVRLGMKQRLSELKWVNYAGDMHGIQANSVNAANAKTELNGLEMLDPKCVETKRLSQSLFNERQEIVHPTTN